MQLVGKKVKHKKYGSGVITDQIDNKVQIRFKESQKLFLYPEAFRQHLRIDNNFLQNKIDQLNEEKSLEDIMKKQNEERENKSRNLACKLKISSNSQVIFNISEKLISEAGELKSINVGCYLSGEMKGKPRIPANIKPNSAILFSDFENMGEERSVLGIAMVDECFLGTECKDGEVQLHKQHRLILKNENRLPFWKYFDRESFSLKWGRVPFKHFQNDLMQEIILDICNTLEGTNQEESIKEFYHYFCSINRLSE